MAQRERSLYHRRVQCLTGHQRCGGMATVPGAHMGINTFLLDVYMYALQKQHVGRVFQRLLLIDIWCMKGLSEPL